MITVRDSMMLIMLEHKACGSDGVRLGQRFVNKYIKNPWPDLFYEPNDHKAMGVIKQWLIDHQYECTMPPIVQ